MKSKKFVDANGRDRIDRVLHYAGDLIIADRSKRTKTQIRKWWKNNEKIQEAQNIKLDPSIQAILDAYREA